MNDEVERYQAVTANDVSAFASERLGENNRASLLFVPREEPEGELVAAGADAEAR